jgi:hypothetical protein
MRKTNVDKILLKGSPKQRMSIILEYRASGSYGRPSPITESEYKTLFDSFKSDYEVKLFNKMAEQERAIRYYLPNIQNMYHLYMSKVINLRGLCLLWMEYNREEEVFNQLLQTAKDEETKEEMRKIIQGRRLLWADVKTDKEGFIEIITDKKQKRVKPDKDKEGLNLTEAEVEGTNLQKVINLLSKEATEYLSSVKTMIEVVREFMKNTTEIKIYRDMLNELEDPLFNDNSPLPIFNKAYYNGKSWITGANQGETLKEFYEKNYQNNEEMLSKYWVFPEYSEAVIDEEFFTEQYQGFKDFE